MTNANWIRGLSDNALLNLVKDMVQEEGNCSDFYFWAHCEWCKATAGVEKCPSTGDNSCPDFSMENWLFMERLSTIKEAENERL